MNFQIRNKSPALPWKIRTTGYPLAAVQEFAAWSL
jgi:hypothetical protein